MCPAVGQDPKARLELGRRRKVDIEGLDRPIPVASPEDIVIHKLKWFEMGGGVSDRQWSDALGVLRVQSHRIDVGYLKQRAEEVGVEDLLEELLDEVSIDD